MSFAGLTFMSLDRQFLKHLQLYSAEYIHKKGEKNVS